MKQLFEFIPVILFFITYKLYDIYIATAVIIGATVIQVGISWIINKKVEKMQWVTLGLIIVFGGLTLYFRDEQFIKWKLTIIEWLFGLAFIGSQFIGEKTFIERMMGASIELPAPIWTRLNLAWASFFFSVGAINIYVMQNFSTDDWVTFKTFGVPGLMLAFIVIQMLFIYKHIPDPEE